MCAVGASVGANGCIVGAPIGAWVRCRCIRRCILEPWVQNGCIIRFRDAPMQYAYAPMGKNGCIEEKESPAANLLAVSKKAAGLPYFVLNPRSSDSTGIVLLSIIFDPDVSSRLYTHD